LVLNVSKQDEWMKTYQRLVAYKKKYGRNIMEPLWKTDPQIREWVCNERIDLLNSIGFVWKASSRRNQHMQTVPV